MDALSIPILFVGTAFLVILAIEAGHRLGVSIQSSADGKGGLGDNVISASILTLLAFLLAFTFGTVTSRYDARKELVRREANAIGTAYLRSDFLPDSDRAQAASLLREYVSNRLGAIRSQQFDQIQPILDDADRIQHELWDMAVENALDDVRSRPAALYAEALNEVIDVHALRIAIGLQTRTPNGIWLTLYALLTFGMVAAGHQTAIPGAKRSWPLLVLLAVSFSVVLTLVASLDRPQTTSLLPVSQQPLVDLEASMSVDVRAGEPGGSAGTPTRESR